MRGAAISLMLAVWCAAALAKEAALDVLEWHCVKCHNAAKAKGELDLSTRAEALKGGESGAAIVAGDAEESLLMKSVRHLAEPHMPHNERKLSEDAIAILANWIDAGAKYERTLRAVEKPAEFQVTEKERDHWAFQPVKRPPAPKGAGNAIDRFVRAKLSAAGLKFSKEASKEALIRRVTFDLIGLPPTVPEIDAFLADESERAYEQVVDRLLASPHYGERWGRHWLDLVRFAESDGFEHDAVRPHAWRYRDYVVRSFNADKPYDRFVREQLAGDEIWPDEPEAIVATAFALLGPDMVDSSDQVQRRHNTLNDITDTTALAFLGLTVGCARCHDHKFEPISQRDYYTLQAFFAPAKFLAEREIPTPAERAAHSAALQAYEENEAVRALRQFEAPARAKLFERKIAALSPEAQMAHRTPLTERNAEQANLALETADKVAVTEKDLAAEFKGDEKKRREELIAAVKRVAKPEPLAKSMALGTSANAARARVLLRGDYNNPGDEVQAGPPAVLERASFKAKAKTPRAQLAEWIVSRENPLAARVMVNRIWQQHFGRGLVGSASEFGTRGETPTHPELLDWLASEFIAGGWRMKRMHKLMLMSETYRQGSAASGAGLEKDPENKLYWRMNRLRLEGEAIRDALLAMSGELKLEMGGPGVYPPIPKELFAGATGWPAAKDASTTARRSIYIFQRRNLRFPFLEVFDAPDNNLSCSRRERSTTAPQSLTLLNSDEVLRAAKLTAARIEKYPASKEAQVIQAYRLALGRQPSRQETDAALEFLENSPLAELCRALFNLNDFLYVQ